jgi:hypothetical protein
MSSLDVDKENFTLSTYKMIIDENEEPFFFKDEISMHDIIF